MFKKISYFIMSVCAFSLALAQKKITGRIIGFDLEIPMAMMIYDKDSIEIGATNEHGYFEIITTSDILLLRPIDYDMAKITIPKDCENLEIILPRTIYSEFASSRKIDRIRKRGFSHLDIFHLRAFEKGLFKTRQACHKQEFIPIKPELDKYSRQNEIIKDQIKLDFKNLVLGDTLFVAFGTQEYEKKTLINYTAYGS